MFSNIEKLIAFRFFFSKRKEKFISINTTFSFIGIMLGVATLIIVMSVFNGFKKELITRILGINAHITIYGYKSSLTEYQKIIKELKTYPEITITNPLIDAKAMITTKEGGASAALVKGITLADLEKKSLVKNGIQLGDIKNFNQKNSILIGNQLAYKLGVSIGDFITLVSPQTTKSLFGIIPRLKDYQVVGIFKIGMYEYDSTAVFIPFETAQLHFNQKKSASAIEIMTNDIENTKILSNKLFQDLTKSGYQVSVNDWQALNSSFINALNVERNVMFLILSLIIIVASFNIISSLIMLTNDKIKHIALLKAMGMTKNSITKIFFINGALIGLIGTASGVIFGTLFSYNINSIKLWLESLTGSTLFDPIIYFLTDLPAEVSLNTVALVSICSLLISFLSAIYPARKAAKLESADILSN